MKGKITKSPQKQEQSPKNNIWFKLLIALGAIAFVFLCSTYFIEKTNFGALSYNRPAEKPRPKLNKKAYDIKMLKIGLATTTVSTTTLASFEGLASTTPWQNPWPVKAAYPKYGALLPSHRIVAYYGNFYSTKMGVLGEYEPDEMLSKLRAEVGAWNTADPSTPVVPAIHYIAVTAQGSAGEDGKYRARMPDSQIEHALKLAKEVNGIVFLDIQVGLSDLPSEIPLLKKYLELPEVNLAIDPEFAMQPSGARPGTIIGTYDAEDINYAANYLADIVRKYDLPPKILIVHRFTEAMVTNSENIKPLPEVQIVMDMDGWGSPAHKRAAYREVIKSEPVQFTGFKLFYKNDLKPEGSYLMTPADVLKLAPQPVYIQYQ